MAASIRMARAGAKKRPYYKIVVADSRAPRDGRFIEKIGSYNPLLPKNDPLRVVLKADRIQHWLSAGAKPSETVVRFLNAAKLGQSCAHVKLTNEKHKKKVALKKLRLAEEKKNAEAAAKEKEAAEKEAAAAASAEKPAA